MTFPGFERSFSGLTASTTQILAQPAKVSPMVLYSWFGLVWFGLRWFCTVGSFLLFVKTLVHERPVGDLKSQRLTFGLGYGEQEKILGIIAQ